MCKSYSHLNLKMERYAERKNMLAYISWNKMDTYWYFIKKGKITRAESVTEKSKRRYFITENIRKQFKCTA